MPTVYSYWSFNNLFLNEGTKVPGFGKKKRKENQSLYFSPTLSLLWHFCSFAWVFFFFLLLLRHGLLYSWLDLNFLCN